MCTRPKPEEKLTLYLPVCGVLLPVNQPVVFPVAFAAATPANIQHSYKPPVECDCLKVPFIILIVIIIIIWVDSSVEDELTR